LKNEQQQNEEVKTQFLNLKEIFLKFSQEQKQTIGDMFFKIEKKKHLFVKNVYYMENIDVN